MCLIGIRCRRVPHRQDRRKCLGRSRGGIARQRLFSGCGLDRMSQRLRLHEPDHLSPTSAVRAIIWPAGYHLFTGSADSRENLLQLENLMQLTPPTDPAHGMEPTRRSALMDKARELEASFLSEMLSFAGLGAERGEFSGGVGEDQFASFLRDGQARAMVRHGGIGLAEQLFNALARRDHDQG